ncbi:hypothetical protein NITMOv2_2437 [Nitrospira moscoviensis]|uniref:Uncharacterized protein n=1 Tax=Nitrospira moscoviensis TaxID=42253 RepID=A0A0K2GD17_NITMO|nr:hypothetical protein NITMOv2_2437 [Nitrospira moscoviensis]
MRANRVSGASVTFDSSRHPPTDKLAIMPRPATCSPEKLLPKSTGKRGSFLVSRMVLSRLNNEGA